MTPNRQSVWRASFNLAALSAAAFLLGAPAHADFNLLLRDVTGGSDGNPNNTTEAETILALGAPNTAYSFTDSFDTRTRINLPGGGNYGANDAMPDGGGARERYVLHATAYLRIPAGDWTIAFGSDDGGRLILDDGDGNPAAGLTFGTKFNSSGSANEVRFEGARGHGWTGGQISVPVATEVFLDGVMFESGGGDSYEIAIFEGHTTAFSSTTWVLLEDGAKGWKVSATPLISTPPLLTALEPADDTGNANPAGPFVATFDENVKLVPGGAIYITNLDTSAVTVIAATDSTQATTAGSQLIISPNPPLAYSTTYAITFGQGDTISDFDTTALFWADTTFGTTSWNVTTADFDPTPPLILSTDPADGASNVFPGATLTATFDDAIAAGAGNITLKEVGGAAFATIAVTDASQVSISDNDLVITPSSPLPAAALVAVQLEAGAVRNFSNVGNAAINDEVTWNFDTASATTFIGSNKTNGDNWSVGGNWDVAVPSGALNVVIPAGKQVTSDGGTAVPYTGDLTLQGNAYLQIGWVNPRHQADFNALGTPGQTTITTGNGSQLHFRAGSYGTIDVPEIAMTGNLTIRMGSSTEPVSNFDFAHGINGPHTLTLFGKNNQDAIFSAPSSFAELVITSSEGSYDVFATTALALNGNVTVLDNNGPGGAPDADLTIGAADAIADSATLALNGSATATLITMNADDTVAALAVNGFPFPAGTYGSPATAAANPSGWIGGTGILTVSGSPADGTAPGAPVITDNSVSGEIFLSLQPTITYTLTFNEPVETSVTAADFELSGTASATIDSVTRTNFDEIQVAVTAGSTGTVQLRVKASASFDDLFGNTVSGPFTDPDTITIRDIADIESQLGIPNLTLNNGVNPATGNLWQAGDTYRLVFVSSTTTVADTTSLAVYDAHVQAAADAAGVGAAAGVSWKAIASAGGDHARDHTDSNPAMDGASESIWMMNSQKIANNYADLWDGLTGAEALDIDENGDPIPQPPSTYPWYTWSPVWTGTNSNGTQAGAGMGSGGNVNIGLANGAASAGQWIARSSVNSALSENGGNGWDLYLYGMSEVLTVTITGGAGPSAYDTWASSYGVGARGDDDDGGGKSNLYEFGLGGKPTDRNDDRSLLHVFSADVADGSEREGVLTILVRNGATFSDSGNDQTATIDGITYRVAGENTLPVASGAKVGLSGTVVTTGLPAAPAGYQYASLYLTGPRGYFQVTITATAGGDPGGGGAYAAWAASSGLTGAPGLENGQADDPDGGGKSNLYEFGLGGNPVNRNDDRALLHAFSANVAGGSELEGLLTILVRSGASFSADGNDQTATIDGVTYRVAGDTTLPVAGGAAVGLSGTVVTTGLPAAPAGYQYASFFLTGPRGYFKVTVEPTP